MKTVFVATQIDPVTLKTKPTIINARQAQRIEASDQHAGLTVIEFGYMQPEVFVTESVVEIWDRLNGTQQLPGEPAPDNLPFPIAGP
ncbi:hypothetical protein ACW9YQ_27855 (plasmid) [Paraburkholderia strydomiana]